MKRLALLFALLSLPASAHVLSNGRITLTLADPAKGQTTTMDRVDSIAWKDSAGDIISDYVSNGGAAKCGDPSEFFGQSYGDVDGATLLMVVQGAAARWTSADQFHGTSQTRGGDACATLSGRTNTAYTLFTASTRHNMVKVVRTFTFSKAARNQAFNLRAYAPRLSLNGYNSVMYSTSTSSAFRFPVSDCPTACVRADWDGRWFAVDGGNFRGIGMLVIRDPSSTAPATLDGDFDSFSNSNVTSIVLTRPSSGWRGTVTETEYLCFYDPETWSIGRQGGGQLPKGCALP